MPLPLACLSAPAWSTSLSGRHHYPIFFPLFFFSCFQFPLQMIFSRICRFFNTFLHFPPVFHISIFLNSIMELNSTFAQITALISANVPPHYLPSSRPVPPKTLGLPLVGIACTVKTKNEGMFLRSFAFARFKIQERCFGSIVEISRFCETSLCSEKSMMC